MGPLCKTSPGVSLCQRVLQWSYPYSPICLWPELLHLPGPDSALRWHFIPRWRWALFCYFHSRPLGRCHRAIDRRWYFNLDDSVVSVKNYIFQPSPALSSRLIFAQPAALAPCGWNRPLHVGLMASAPQPGPAGQLAHRRHRWVSACLPLKGNVARGQTSGHSRKLVLIFSAYHMYMQMYVCIILWGTIIWCMM